MTHNSMKNLRNWMTYCRPWVNKYKIYDELNNFNFVIMSYNILSQNAISKNISLYNNCEIESLCWKMRYKLIIKEIEIIDPDILCIQEATIDHYNKFLVPTLNRNEYQSIYKVKNTNLDGCAIFYKTNKLELIKHKEVEFLREDICKLLDKPNVGLIALFKPKNSNITNHFVVGTTHILFNLKRYDVKLQQIRLFLAELEKMAFKFYSKEKKKNFYHPIVVCGDFNLEPNSRLFHFINHGVLEWKNKDLININDNEKKRNSYINEENILLKGIDFNSKFCNETILNEEKQEIPNIIKHNLKLKSVFKCKTENGLNIYTTKINNIVKMVDYIFYNKNSHLKLIGILKLPNEKLIEKYIPWLPNSFLGSDHFSLAAKFVLKNHE